MLICNRPLTECSKQLTRVTEHIKSLGANLCKQLEDSGRGTASFNAKKREISSSRWK